MNQKALSLRQELPQLIEAAKTLEASVLVMLLMNVDEEVRKRELARQRSSEGGPADPSSLPTP